MTAAVDHEVQALLSDALARLAARHAFAGRRGGALPRSVDGAAYADMAGMGLVGLGYPAEAGGFGAGATAVGSVCRAIGRALLLVPYLSTGVLVPVLARGADEEATAALALDDVLAGTRILALAHAEPRLGFSHGPLATEAVIQRDGAATLSGRKSFVLDAELADAFLVSARGVSGRTALYLVDRDAAGLVVQARRGVDERPAGEILLDGAPARLVVADAAVLLREASDRAALAACAEALGAMEQVLAATQSHLQSRRAFGQSLSQFQVLRHRFADMHVAVEETSAILSAAEQAWDLAADDRSTLLAACKVTTGRRGRAVVESGIQLHGGIGVTDDLDVSHHFKRVMMLDACFGDDEHHLARHAAAIFHPDSARQGMSA